MTGVRSLIASFPGVGYLWSNPLHCDHGGLLPCSATVEVKELDTQGESALS